MTKWEYGTYLGIGWQALRDWLDKIGNEGWEIIYVHQHSEPHTNDPGVDVYYDLFAKRPRASGWDGQDAAN